MASMGRSGRNAPMCCSHGRAFSPTFACLPPSHSPRTTVVERTEIITVQQTPIAREDLAVPPALFPHGKQCIIQLKSFLLSGSLTPDQLASVCATRAWLGLYISLQFSPLLVSRRPGNAPGGVGPCARRCARSSRRGGVEIDGAQVPRRSRRRRKRQSGPTAATCTTITAALLSRRCMKVAVSMEKLPGTCFAGGDANGLELRRSLWLEVGSVRQRRRVKTGPAAAPAPS